MCTTKRINSDGGVGSRHGYLLKNNENGSALVIALVVLAVVSLLAQILSEMSTSEIQIAGSDRLHKETFYAADGATELAAELLEQNVACPTGFTNATRGSLIDVEQLAFWQNSEDAVETPGDGGAGEQPRDFYLPDNYSAGEPHTQFYHWRQYPIWCWQCHTNGCRV